MTESLTILHRAANNILGMAQYLKLIDSQCMTSTPVFHEIRRCLNELFTGVDNVGNIFLQEEQQGTEKYANLNSSICDRLLTLIGQNQYKKKPFPLDFLFKMSLLIFFCS